ncbi:MAG: fructoselysine 6-kinase [Clostridiaceae bacterium]|nr:fructoselysine 6-kinase [Eubacteriales bacterium]
MIKLACAGDNCIDYYGATGEKYPGGNPVNVAVYARRLGGAASYIGAVGTDENGKLLLNALEGKGVDVSRVHIVEGATALTHVAIVNGDRVFGDYHEGVMEGFALTQEDITFIEKHDMLVSGLWGRVEGELKRISERGVPIAFDCSDRPESPQALVALAAADIAFFSDDISDDAALRARIRAIAAQGPRVVVATRGARGSLAYDGAGFTEQGIIDCTVVDTMGAGDSFLAGFLCAYLRGGSTKGCLLAGAQSSAVTLGYRGAW